MSIDKWMDKEAMYDYTIIYYSAIERNTFESVLVDEPRAYYTV